MIDIKTLKNTGFFSEISLKKGDILFNQGDIDGFLYIVISGNLIIDTSLQNLDQKYKIIGNAKSGDIIGEGSLSNNSKKQVRIISESESQLLKIDGKKDFPKFVSKYPDFGYTLLTDIIDAANKRLLQANKEITANFEVNRAISKIKDISNTSINKLLLIFQTILGVDQILFLEKNIAMDEYFKCIFNSKSKTGTQNTILKFEEGIFSKDVVKKSGISLSRHIRSVRLKLGDENYGYLVAGKDTRDFYENEEKLLRNTAGSFVAVIHQKELMKDNQNKEHMKSFI